MRIAQVAPLIESVPPQQYGGTERVVAYLTDALVARGNDVTLFASGDSTTAARLIAPVPHSLRLDPACVDQVAPHLLLIEWVADRAHEFDVVHFHIDYLHYPTSRRAGYRHVTTLHGRLDIPELPTLYDEFDDMPVVSISDAQRTPLPMANWRATVYHGLPAALYGLVDRDEGYLAFIGRISREKRVDRAIEIARQAGLPLRVAAKIDDADRAYFDAEVRPLFDEPFVDYIGEIGEADKNGFLGGARALLFPIDWQEPFGLVMIEAMACGTPVIAWPGGSVAEVLEPGLTGFIVDSIEAAVEAVGRSADLDRTGIRAEFDRRFTADRMAADYLAVYEQLIDDAPRAPGRALAGRHG
jgi:glycosyltransferase involved in cell wall biosynthesis